MNLKLKDWMLFMFLGFILTIPISQYASSRIMGLLLLMYIPRIKPKVAIRLGWPILIYVAVISAGLLYSEDIGYGLGVLETNLSLILLPLLFSTQDDLDEKRLNSFMFAFVTGACLGSGICLINAFFQYSQSGTSTVFLYYELTSFLDFQPTYYAYFLVFAITICLFLLSTGKAPFCLEGMSLVILFLFGMLLLTGGRTSFISMLLVFAFFVLKFFLDIRGRVQNVVFALVVFMIAGLFATTAVVGDTMTFSDSWDRTDLWESAMAANSDPWIGVGTGDFKNVLNSHFMSHGMPQYASDSLNAHNQFIQTYLSNGLAGILSLAILMGWPLYLAFRRDHTLTILVLFPFAIYGMTEVFLGRYQGVVFYAFIYQAFVSHLLNQSKPIRTV